MTAVKAKAPKVTKKATPKVTRKKMWLVRSRSHYEGDEPGYEIYLSRPVKDKGGYGYVSYSGWCGRVGSTGREEELLLDLCSNGWDTAMGRHLKPGTLARMLVTITPVATKK